jgi:hypothetical protein
VFVRGNLATLVVLLLIISGNSVMAQSPNGSISGIVLDPDAKSIPGAEVIILNDLNGAKYVASTNNEGIYAVPNLPPGTYRMQVSKQGFKSIIRPDIILNVEDALSVNFTLPIGAASVVVTVEGGAPMINTQDATVSTVVDRQFAENLPLNGRSFQSLINLAPGVVVTASNYADGGQFSIDGQRPSSNYWMVDGVGANIGVGVNPTLYPGNGLSGALGSFSAMGGTNSLVSVDAMQEFRIQTSTYAPEFGRTPGGQISIATRSGTNQFHGTLFDYFRNDVLDANDWFANYNRLPKPEERQNDFGGTVSGPIRKEKTFFFFSYEGLRLRLPVVGQTTVPDLAARQSAIASLQPYLNAYPKPNGSDDPSTGMAQFNASYSNRSTLDAYSLRLDHKLTNAITLFGRYAYSPSEIIARGNGGSFSLNTVSPTRITTQTATIGTTWTAAPTISNDLRFNYSHVDAASHSVLDDFGGAAVPATLPFPPSINAQNGLFFFAILSLQQGYLENGQIGQNLQRQVNLVDAVSMQKGAHALKFGVDFRRLSPIFGPFQYEQSALFDTVSSAVGAQLLAGAAQSNLRPTLLFRNLGVYAQDSWRVLRRLTVTYGLRWDVDFVPSTVNGPTFPGVTGFDLANLANLALAPAGVPPYRTGYGNVAPRIGMAYVARQSQDAQTVIRGGFGVFYDLASSQFGTLIGTNHYPFGNVAYQFGGTFPLDAAAAAPPPIVPPTAANQGTLYGFDPHLKLPYTLEWNIAVQQGLGRAQSVSLSYVGAKGSRLLQTVDVLAPNPNLSAAQLVTGLGDSNYNAAQVQFQRRLLSGLQALASYTFSHSIDTASAGSDVVASNTFVPAALAGSNRGPSDFDIRHALSAALTYDLPTPRADRFIKMMLRGWSTENTILARSAPPVTVIDAQISGFANGFGGAVRPDLVSGQPLYLYGSQYPGGRAFNPAAFAAPPVDPTTSLPLRQGNVGRNTLRAFGATQWDFAIHRDFPIHESFLLQFRGELFNVLNHPNFGPPSGNFGAGGFGLATQVLSQSLNNGNLGSGAFSPLYQIGGPRSVQLALKLKF